MGKEIDNKTVKVTGGEYFTAQDMANYLGVTSKVINMRLFRLGIKPIAKDALYLASALDAIRDVTMGRPKKPKTKDEGTAKPAAQGKTKSAKTKK